MCERKPSVTLIVAWRQFFQLRLLLSSSGESNNYSVVFLGGFRNPPYQSLRYELVVVVLGNIHAVKR